MSEQTLCVHWPRFGPYHVARLEALDQRCRERNIRLVGLETAVSDNLYEWDIESGRTSFERVQVFPDRTFEQIPPSEMHAGVQDVLQRISPDVIAIHTYSFPDSRACLNWSARSGRASILMTDTKSDDAPRSSWREFLKSLLVETFDAALLPGTPHFEYFTSLGMPSDAIHPGYSVVDNDFFRIGARSANEHPGSVSRLPGLGDTGPFFLASNRFIERKNLTGLLEAYSLYRAHSNCPWPLVLLGDGPLGQSLKSIVSRNGIEDVTFAGFQQIENLPAYYGLAGCFIHPATIDPWGLVVNEAMAAELPVIVSTGAGCHVDLVRDGDNGFTFAPSDTESLAKHMALIAEDDAFRRRASRISSSIIRDWSLDLFALRMIDAMKSALDRRGRGLNPLVRMTIAVLRRAPSVTAFHTVQS